MNVFHKAALRSLINSRARTLVTIVGVVLSAALVTGAITFGLSLLNYAAAGAEGKYGRWHACFWDADKAFCDARAKDDGVTGAFTAESLGYALLSGCTNPDKPYLYITGFSDETFAALPITLLSGRLPETDDEILIPAHVSSNGGVELALGDTLALDIGARTDGGRLLSEPDAYRAGETLQIGEQKTYTVVGFYLRPSFEGYTAPGYTAITKADGVGGQSQNLFIALHQPKTARAYAESAAEGHAVSYNNQVLRFFGLSNEPSDNLFNALLNTIGGIVLAIVVTGSVFLIYNAFSITLSERMQQIGLLSSVGATARQIRNMALFEGACIGLVGIPLGVGLGLAGTRLVIALVAENFYSIMYAGVKLRLCVSLPALAAAACVSLSTILISAYLPARKAARTPVLDCIRGTVESELDAASLKTPKIAEQLWGLPGLIAAKNFKRNKKRYRSIVLSLVLSVVLFVSSSAFVMDLKQLMSKAASFTTYDIGFGTQEMADADLFTLFDKLKMAEGATDGAMEAVMEATLAAPKTALSDAFFKRAGGGGAGIVALPMEVLFLDDDAYARLIAQNDLPTAELTGENAPLLTVAKVMPADDTGKIEVGDLDDLFIGRTAAVTVTPAAGGARGESVTLLCADFVPPDIPPTKAPSAYAAENAYSLTVLAPWSRMDSLFSGSAANSLRVKGLTFSSENPAKTMAAIQGMLRSERISSAYLLINTADVFEENRSYIFIANVFSYVFIVMISLIAAANVFNTVSTNVKLRRRELAMLRSVGMEERAFNRMMRLECALCGARALALGLPLAVLFSYGVYRGVFSGDAGAGSFSLPLGSMLVSVLSVLAVIFAAMMYAVKRIRRENIIDALRDDMT